MTDPIIGRRHFIGTSPRPVYEEAQTGRQYVVDFDDEGNKSTIPGSDWLQPERLSEGPKT